MLNEWERRFVLSMKARKPHDMTRRQSLRLHNIHGKASRL